MYRADVGILRWLLDGHDVGGGRLNLHGFDIIVLVIQRQELKARSRWAKDADGNAKAFTKQAHCPESLLVAGTAAPNKYFDGVYDELVLVIFQGTDDTLECGRHVCKILPSGRGAPCVIRSTVDD